MNRHVDVLIVGAGLSGIGVACHLQRDKADHSFVILERRQAIGGTWDLFRYPGIRSDSDMLTLGYEFKPWRGTKVLADGPAIKRYVEEAADENGVTEHIRFGRKVTAARWNSGTDTWTVEAVDESTGAAEQFTANFLVGCTGYYDYDNGYQPDFPGLDSYRGTLVHPQHWPEDLDYSGKKVVVIGSGATAITLVPALADDADHVTMLQRSPSYIATLPSQDPVSYGLNKALVPPRLVYGLARRRNILLQQGLYKLARSQPDLVRKMLFGTVRAQVGAKVDMRHFTPNYNPWDQRLCMVPDGDLFSALRKGKASIVTDRIATFTETGIALESGAHLDADIVVSATGLTMQMFGGANLFVDGTPVNVHDNMFYKGAIPEGLPNSVMVFGYTNASWTLKVDLTAGFLCRLLATMRKKGVTRVVARGCAEDRAEGSMMGEALTSGYVQRGNAVMPRQGKRTPWKVVNSYFRDREMIRNSPVEDGILEFGGERNVQQAG